MAQFSYDQQAEPGDVFAEGAFDSQIGKSIPFRVGGSDAEPVTARVVDAEVRDEGQSVHMTLEVSDSIAAVLREPIRGISVKRS